MDQWLEHFTARPNFREHDDIGEGVGFFFSSLSALKIFIAQSAAMVVSVMKPQSEV